MHGVISSNISTAGSDARHEYILTTNAQGGEIIQFYIEMACNGMFGAGNGLIGPPDPNRFFNLNELVCGNWNGKERITDMITWHRILLFPIVVHGIFSMTFRLSLEWQEIFLKIHYEQHKH